LNQLLAITRNNDGIHCFSETIPKTFDITSLNNLGESPSLDVTDFDKLTIKEKYVWWMDGDAFSSALPFDGTG